MGVARLSVCGLALLAVCGAAIARPAEETERTGDEIVRDTLFDTCPHAMHGNATAQQEQGVWYVLEALFPQERSEEARVLRTLPCLRYNFTFDSTRQSLSVREVDNEQNWTYNLATSGMWENAAVTEHIHLSMSADGQLLLICFTTGGREVELSAALGRRPDVGEDAVAAAHTPFASRATSMRLRQNICEAPPATPTVFLS